MQSNGMTTDPLKPPVLSLTADEVDEIAFAIEEGNLPSDYFGRIQHAVDCNVFGHDHKKDRDGNPVEQGRGSAANPTRQSVEAYRKWGKDELEYERILARMEKQLKDAEPRQKAEAEGRREAEIDLKRRFGIPVRRARR
jgi:hypothetical protein